MSKKLKCYFAHSWRSIDSPDKARILKILEERRVEVIDPFIGEDKMCERYDEKSFYPNCNYRLGRAIWAKDLGQILKADMFLLWKPDITGSFLGCGYELCYAFMNGKFIQIISPQKHMPFTFILSRGNQYYESIEDYDRMRVTKW